MEEKIEKFDGFQLRGYFSSGLSCCFLGVHADKITAFENVGSSDNDRDSNGVWHYSMATHFSSTPGSCPSRLPSIPRLGP